MSWELGVENRGHDFDLEGRGYEAGSWSMVNDLSQHLSAIMISSQHYSQPTWDENMHQEKKKLSIGPKYPYTPIM